MAMCLLALEKCRGYVALGASSVEQYASTKLDLQRQKFRELLRVARSLEGAHFMRQAFSSAQLNWARVRELSRHVTAENDAELTAWGLCHTAEQIQNALVMSPRAWRGQASSRPGADGQVSSSAPGSALPSPFEHSCPAVQEQPAGPVQVFLESGDTAAARTDPAPVPASDGPAQAGKVKADLDVDPLLSASAAGDGETQSNTVVAGSASPGAAAGVKVRPTLPEGIGCARRLRVALYLSPDDYAVLERALSKVAAVKGKRVSREKAVMDVCRHFLGCGTAPSKIRYQILVHESQGGQWYDTDRGLLPVSEPIQRMANGRPPLPPDDGQLLLTSLRSRRPPGPGPKKAAVESRVVPDLNTSGTPISEASSAATPTCNGVRLPGVGAGPETLPQSGSSSGNCERSTQAGLDTASSGCVSISKGLHAGSVAKVNRRIPLPTLRALYRRAQGRCEGCGERHGLQVHHVIPISEGGDHSLDNLRLYCRACHDATHHADFDQKPGWQAARQRAVTGGGGSDP
ncbi:MAG TPA: HNH endonuclease signature motif containing protein [Candidatus Xenobia bacterium]